MEEKLTELFRMCRKEVIPQEFKMHPLSTSTKRKRNLQVCDNQSKGHLLGRYL